MNKVLPYFTCAVVLSMWSTTLCAQESVNASGSEATGSGGTVSYSIGQVEYNSYTGSNGSVEQGVQHAYEIYSVSVGDLAIDVALSAHPNPTTDHLTLEVTDGFYQNLKYAFFDITGKVIYQGDLSSAETVINTNALPNGTYMVRVENNQNQLIQSFKIIKN